MSSLKDDFNELLERVHQGRDLGHASYEPIYYLVFSPEQILRVKRQIPAWTAKMKNDGWSVHIFSIWEQVQDILSQAPMRKIWVMADKRAPTDWRKTNQSLANALLNENALQTRLEQTLKELESRNKPILFVTDLEALHPYMRIGAIETNIQGKFTIPTVFFYPGERAGKSQLKFLGFYHADGNYRSTHVGG